MKQPALLSLPMDDPAPPPLEGDVERLYEAVLVRAMAHAEQHLSRDQAFELAHNVALDLLNRPPQVQSGALIYFAVTYRLRNMRRGAERRAVAEGAYVDFRERVHPAWSQPGAELEARELRERIDAVIARMPPAMREVFVLVREQELTYKETAARLGVRVGTVHTQLSRANALLRECVERYESGEPEPNQPNGRQP